MKPLVRLLQADLDVEQALAYYAAEAPHMELNFLDALEKAYVHIQRHPGTGSPRYAHALDIPGLRFWPCQHFPQMVFYVERDDHIALVRVLHGSRDIPATFQDLTD
jgi:toxin ParE1/3/4